MTIKCFGKMYLYSTIHCIECNVKRSCYRKTKNNIRKACKNPNKKLLELRKDGKMQRL